jgi:hypothetical protein
MLTAVKIITVKVKRKRLNPSRAVAVHKLKSPKPQASDILPYLQKKSDDFQEI